MRVPTWVREDVRENGEVREKEKGSIKGNEQECKVKVKRNNEREI